MSGQRKKRTITQTRPQPKPVPAPVETAGTATEAGVTEPVEAVVSDAPVKATASKQAVTAQRVSVKGSRESARSRYEKNKREMRLLKIGSGILAALLVIAIGYGVYNWAQDRDVDQPPEAAVQDYTYPGSQHTEAPVEYAEHPPVGGSHDSVWYTCQYYDQIIRTENAVHSMEHGAVWITYDPNLPQEQRDRIKSITEEQSYILASPMENLPAPVVASVWNHQILLQSADDDDLMRFIATYKQGPDTPEPGASCSGITNPEGI